MKAEFRWDGLKELQAALRALPEDLAGEASHIVEGTANGAVVMLKRIYGEHRVSGRLRDSTFAVRREAGKYGAAYQVKVNDPIAWLFDNGSQARHYLTATGYHETGAMWGRTPPTHVFVRTVTTERRKMYGQLKDLLVRHGLSVSGAP